MKKAYLTRYVDDEHVIAVVAENCTQAKSFGFNAFQGEVEWTEIRANWKRDVDVNHLPLGEINDELWCLKVGLYGYIEATCPRCGQKSTTIHYNMPDIGDNPNDGFCCIGCEDDTYLPRLQRILRKIINKWLFK